MIKHLGEPGPDEVHLLTMTQAARDVDKDDASIALNAERARGAPSDLYGTTLRLVSARGRVASEMA